MWEKEERNRACWGQNMNFDSVGSEVPFMQNMRFPPPINGPNMQFFPEASRKRKTVDNHLGGYAYGGVSSSLGNLRPNIGHPLREDYTLQHNEGLPPAVVSQMNNPNMYTNQNPEYAKRTSSESDQGNYQFYAADNSLSRIEAKEEYINKLPLGSLQQFYHSEPSQPIKPPVWHVPRTHDSRHLVCDPASQSEPGRFVSSFGHRDGPKEMSEASLRSNNTATHFGHEHNNQPCNPYPYPRMPSKTLAFADSSEPRMVGAHFHSDGGTAIQNLSTSGLKEVRGSDQDTWSSEGGSTSIGTSSSMLTSVIPERRETYAFSQYHNTAIKSGDFVNNDSLSANLVNVIDNGQSGSTISQLPESSITIEACLENRMVNNSIHSCKDSGTQILKNGDASITTKHDPLLEGTSPERDSNLASKPAGPSDELHLNLEEQGGSVAGNRSPLIVEKLWDGILQLNTSTIVSAVAFFKSGEKAQDINWSERVEVKGKVRLQAFENFIQELPRSRNRTLMSTKGNTRRNVGRTIKDTTSTASLTPKYWGWSIVTWKAVISLCWKAGSTEAGLTGIKQVAKGYRDGKKVGFAQICPGFDLYVCPRSDAIITILAKCGFFKGMTAVVEDPDSLIGCIVWRRGNTSSNPVSKVPDRKKVLSQDLPLNLPEPSLLDMNSPIMTVQESESKQERPPNSVIPETRSIPLDSVGPKTTESVIIKSNNDSSDAVPEIAVPVPYSSPLIQLQLSSIQKPDSTLYSEIPITQAAESNKTDFEPKQKVIPGPLQMLIGVQQSTHTHFGIGLHSFGNYNSGPVPEQREQLVMAQKPGSSLIQKPMQSDLEAEVTEPILPGPCPLPPDLLKTIQSEKEARMMPTGGVSEVHRFIVGIGEPNNPVVGLKAKQMPADLDDDDGDLPEFDFDAARGISKAPTSEPSWSTHQTRFPVDSYKNQPPVDEVKLEGQPMLLPKAKPMEVMHKQQDSCFTGKPWTPYQGTTNTQPTRVGELNSDYKPPQVQSLSQQFSVKADKDSASGHTLPRKSHWDDEDDDMPEWCPPDMEHLDQQRLNTIATMPQPVLRPASENAAKPPMIPAPTAFYGPLQSQGAHGHHPGLLGPSPPFVDPLPPLNLRPVVDFIKPDPRPPLPPYPRHPARPLPPSFSTRPFDGNQQCRH
ncbi:Uncharacterized protein M6B38_221625 [Iris pallida]|uniref:Spen paralogue and orthologue SPOC C-terminal domain-containing protein n=1 Tax=Iris pallida TaxID=29817 RepID=A0AAX6DW70_IRIPA|nr:Uncharacterized protein M6B38_221625 [Iris pallida]